MPQFKFYISDRERYDLIEHILSLKTRIVPDTLFDSEKYSTIETVGDFVDLLKSEIVGFFLLDDSYVVEDLEFIDIKIKSSTKYAIYQRKGGPYINASFYLGYAEDAPFPYKYSLIDHYARFIHYDSHEEFPAPEALKAHYTDLVRYIKGMCKQVTKNGKKFWVGKQVLEENPGLLD